MSRGRFQELLEATLPWTDSQRPHQQSCGGSTGALEAEDEPEVAGSQLAPFLVSLHPRYKKGCNLFLMQYFLKYCEEEAICKSKEHNSNTLLLFEVWLSH